MRNLRLPAGIEVFVIDHIKIHSFAGIEAETDVGKDRINGGEILAPLCNSNLFFGNLMYARFCFEVLF